MADTEKRALPVSFARPAMVADHICSAVTHLNPYLAAIGRAVCEEVLANQLKGRRSNGLDFDENAVEIANILVGLSEWPDAEARSLRELALMFMRHHNSTSHRLDKLYDHYLSCQIGRAVIANPDFANVLKKITPSVEAELSDFENVFRDQFACTLHQATRVAEDGLKTGGIRFTSIDQSDSHMKCSVCTSSLRPYIDGGEAIQTTTFWRFREEPTTLEFARRNPDQAGLVNGKLYQFTLRPDTRTQISICSYSHLLHIAVRNTNLCLGHPYFGPEPEGFYGYIAGEQHLLTD